MMRRLFRRFFGGMIASEIAKARRIDEIRKLYEASRTRERARARIIIQTPTDDAVEAERLRDRIESKRRFP